jgi:hypothetical protein
MAYLWLDIVENLFEFLFHTFIFFSNYSKGKGVSDIN